ncbi:MAG: preprotein translocase subunit SecG [Dehalococcoidia bacterium]|jgi:preprotein translocase subunit SecG
MELRDFLSLALILVSTMLTLVVLLQAKGTGFGAALGGQDAGFRTKRGVQRTLHNITIVLAAVFISLAAGAVWAAG